MLCHKSDSEMLVLIKMCISKQEEIMFDNFNKFNFRRSTLQKIHVNRLVNGKKPSWTYLCHLECEYVTLNEPAPNETDLPASPTPQTAPPLCSSATFAFPLLFAAVPTPFPIVAFSPLNCFILTTVNQLKHKTYFFQFPFVLLLFVLVPGFDFFTSNVRQPLLGQFFRPDKCGQQICITKWIVGVCIVQIFVVPAHAFLPFAFFRFFFQ